MSDCSCSNRKLTLRDGDVFIIHDHHGFPCRISTIEVEGEDGIFYSPHSVSSVTQATWYKYETLPTKILNWLNEQDWVKKNYKTVTDKSDKPVLGADGKPKKCRAMGDYVLRKTTIKWEHVGPASPIKAGTEIANVETGEVVDDS